MITLLRHLRNLACLPINALDTWLDKVAGNERAYQAELEAIAEDRRHWLIEIAPDSDEIWAAFDAEQAWAQIEKAINIPPQRDGGES